MYEQRTLSISAKSTGVSTNLSSSMIGSMPCSERREMALSRQPLGSVKGYSVNSFICGRVFGFAAISYNIIKTEEDLLRK